MTSAHYAAYHSRYRSEAEMVSWVDTLEVKKSQREDNLHLWLA